MLKCIWTKSGDCDPLKVTWGGSKLFADAEVKIFARVREAAMVPE